MDSCEATKVIMSRVQSLDPENASKITGCILMKLGGDKEIIRLALSSDSVLLFYINHAKAELPSPSNGFSTNLSPVMPNYPFPQTTPQNLVPNNGFPLNNPSSPFSIGSQKPISYASVLNSSNSSSKNSYNNGLGSSNLNICGGNDFCDELSLADDSMTGQNPIKSPRRRSDSQGFPYGEDANTIPPPHPHPLHRGSCSKNDTAFLDNLEEGGGVGGFGWKPCVYFARGFCRNGNSCKFLHSNVGETIEVGSPSVNNSGFDEFLRMNSPQQQQRLGFMATGGHNPLSYNNNRDFLGENQSPNSAAASSNERQIYLTFPAESKFKEEDVSAYFSKFGPVQDVRIPYQHPQRMFGFVTFVYPETVKLIFEKGNTHYVCDSRVLVKPYKDKAELLDKKQKQHQHRERGEYSSCLSPSRIDPRELFNLPVASPLAPTGSRMLFNTQEMILRRKLEHEAEVQRALELQRQRIMNLQLMNLNNQHHNYRFLPNLPVDVPFSSPRQSQSLKSQNTIYNSNGQNVLQDFDYGQETSNPPGVAADDVEETKLSTNNDDSNFPGSSLEHVLCEYLLASPTKTAAENQSIFSSALEEVDNGIPITKTSSNNSPVVPSSSPPSKATPYHSPTTRQCFGNYDKPHEAVEKV